MSKRRTGGQRRAVPIGSFPNNVSAASLKCLFFNSLIYQLKTISYLVLMEVIGSPVFSLTISSLSAVIIVGGFSLLVLPLAILSKTRCTRSHNRRNRSSISYTEFHLVQTSWISFKHSASAFFQSSAKVSVLPMPFHFS